MFNAGGIVVDNDVYHLSISPSVPDIFALKVHARTHEHSENNASVHCVGGGIKSDVLN